MSLINCKISLTGNCVLSSNAANEATAFGRTDINLFSPAITLSIKDNAKLLQQRNSVFKHSTKLSEKYE